MVMYFPRLELILCCGESGLLMGEWSSVRRGERFPPRRFPRCFLAWASVQVLSPSWPSERGVFPASPEQVLPRRGALRSRVLIVGRHLENSVRFSLHEMLRMFYYFADGSQVVGRRKHVSCRVRWMLKYVDVPGLARRPKKCWSLS